MEQNDKELDLSIRSGGVAGMHAWESHESEVGGVSMERSDDDDLNVEKEKASVSSSSASAIRRRSSNFVKSMLSSGRTKPPRGKMVNGYELCGLLGTGSFATVEKCKKDGQVYAVKIFERSVLARKRYFSSTAGVRGGMKKPRSALDKVEEEIAIMKRLNFDHPNLVRMIEALIDENEDRIYMFIEFVEYGPVMKFDEDTRKFACAIKGSGPCDDHRAATYLHDVATGLAVMHSYQIAHRDLKPDNILLSKDYRAKISDFGVARHFQSLDGDVSKANQPLTEDEFRPARLAKLQRSESQYQVKGTEGTYAYFAPEMLQENRFNALACDLWALGVCGYNFLVGELPFPHIFTDDLFAAITASQPNYEPLADRNDQCILLQALMHPNPKQRASLHDVTKNAWVMKHAGQPEEIIPNKVPTTSFNVIRRVKQMLGSLDENKTKPRHTTSQESTQSSSDDTKTPMSQSSSSSSTKRRKSVLQRFKSTAFSTRKRFLSSGSSSVESSPAPHRLNNATSNNREQQDEQFKTAGSFSNDDTSPAINRPPQPPPIGI